MKVVLKLSNGNYYSGYDWGMHECADVSLACKFDTYEEAHTRALFLSKKLNYIPERVEVDDSSMPELWKQG